MESLTKADFINYVTFCICMQYYNIINHISTKEKSFNRNRVMGLNFVNKHVKNLPTDFHSLFYDMVGQMCHRSFKLFSL